MRRERVAPQPEVIGAILLEDSPCCGVPHRRHVAEGVELDPDHQLADHRKLHKVVHNQRDDMQADTQG